MDLRIRVLRLALLGGVGALLRLDRVPALVAGLDDGAVALGDDLELRVVLAGGALDVRLLRLGLLLGALEHGLERVCAARLVRALRLGVAVAHGDGLAVDVLKAGGDGVLRGLLDLLLDQASGKRAERLVEEVVLRVAGVKPKRVDVDLDALEPEALGRILRAREMVRHRHALATKDNVGQPESLLMAMLVFLQKQNATPRMSIWACTGRGMSADSWRWLSLWLKECQ